MARRLRIALPLFLVVAPLWLCAQTAAVPASDIAGVREKLLGSWHLVSRDEQDADGKIRTRTDAVGVIMYTADGHMSVQIMLPEKGEAPNNPVQYQQAGY